MPNLASHRCACAFASMVSNTGCSSPGELADDLEHLGGRGLLLQQISPQLVEQAGVLDGDDGLGGEVRDQLDLLVGKGPHLLAINGDSADQLAFLEHRHDEQSCAHRRVWRLERSSGYSGRRDIGECGSPV